MFQHLFVCFRHEREEKKSLWGAQYSRDRRSGESPCGLITFSFTFFACIRLITTALVQVHPPCASFVSPLNPYRSPSPGYHVPPCIIIHLDPIVFVPESCISQCMQYKKSSPIYVRMGCSQTRDSSHLPSPASSNCSRPVPGLRLMCKRETPLSVPAMLYVRETTKWKQSRMFEYLHSAQCPPRPPYSTQCFWLG